MGQIQSFKVEFNPNDSEQAVLAILDHRQLDGFKGRASSGYGSMDVYGWIGFWRIVVIWRLTHIQYTLSAVIAAEWSSTKTRGRMMASVFLMQAVGQVAAYAVTLAVLAGLGPRLGLNPDTTDPEVAKRAVDAIWRVVIGVAVYGLGLDNLQVISQMYLSSAAPSIPCDQTWITDPSQPNITIYNMLQEDAIRNLQTISTGALPGSIIILLAIDYVPRAAWLGWTFVSLGGLFAVTGGTYFVSYMNDKHAMTIVFYVLAQLLLNLGPNTMTWILPAELFKTQYRGILYGLSAAAGKLGAITVQIIINQAVRNKGRDAFAGLLLGLCPAMLLGALFTWAWIPEVQLPRGQLDDVSDGSDGAETDSLRTVDSDGRSEEHEGAADDAHAEGKSFLEKLILPNRTLEDIAEDPARDQTIGFGVKFSLLFGKIKRRKQKAAPAVPEMREQRA
ncbi:hypothetical protein GQ53DRAFT_868998 [Thozetella sp. PMI_491]|nr:hypothetical protein GQ53DRAFT_868998 [Thozetella sp. PMI_491]